jgi:hypothetical protein
MNVIWKILEALVIKCWQAITIWLPKVLGKTAQKPLDPYRRIQQLLRLWEKLHAHSNINLDNHIMDGCVKGTLINVWKPLQ